MTVREFAAVGCKILGLAFMLIAFVGFVEGCGAMVIGLLSLSQIGGMEVLSPQGMEVLSPRMGCGILGQAFLPLISPIVELCIGVFVWSQAEAIAARITRDDS